MQGLPERRIGRGVTNDASSLATRYGLGPKLLVVADEDTQRAAPLAMADFTAEWQVFPAHPTASLANAEMVLAKAHEVDGLIAVGSGTINDLTKYAAAQLGKPYLCVATAASMNGYTSRTASLEVNGFKHSHPAVAPRAVLVDLDVLAAAPARLTNAGLGDFFCRSTVEADMLLSHLLLGTPYPRALFDRLRQHERILLGQARGLRARTPEAMHALILALLDGGDAMTEFGSSAVASQGEHMIAHTLEMLAGNNVAHLTHGEVIAITTRTMMLLQEQLLAMLPRITSLAASSAQYRPFGDAAPALMEAYQKKLLLPEEAEALNHTVHATWKIMAPTIQSILLPWKTLEKFFTTLGIESDAHKQHIPNQIYAQAVWEAHLTRERFTFLDLAAMQR